MLSDADIAALYAPKTAQGKGVGKAMVRGDDGKLVTETMTSIGGYNLGGFAGKVGTIRRNRKGATRRLPNGRRRDYRPYMEGVEVIAYKLAR